MKYFIFAMWQLFINTHNLSERNLPHPDNTCNLPSTTKLFSQGRDELYFMREWIAIGGGKVLVYATKKFVTIKLGILPKYRVGKVSYTISGIFW